MKRISATILSFLLMTSTMEAQNLQVHYDFGSLLYQEQSSRPAVKTTVEMFHPDSGGSTFFFVDMDYTVAGIGSAYWEITRELRFWKAPLSVHIEYNGGLTNRFSFKHAYLAGATYSFNSPDHSKNVSLSASFKYIQGHSEPCNFQLTGVWNLDFLNNALLTFTGFFDWWREAKVWSGNSRTQFVFLAEPQFWLNLDRFRAVSNHFKMSIGTEISLSYNFLSCRKFLVMPTLALKWTFR